MSWIKRSFRLLVKLFIFFVFISIFSVICFRFIPVAATPLMGIRVVEAWSDPEKEARWQHHWVPLEKISPNLQKAVIASEDDQFLHHYGFDFDAIEKAMKHNQKGKKIRGGSTISQQTAKNVFLWQGRSWLRKGLEAYFTVLIEIFWSKERIMEVYLNSIEMGDGIYGAEAAAQHWYGVSAEQLSKSQAAGIAAILPNPRVYKASNSGPYVTRRKARIQKLMNYVQLEYNKKEEKN